MIISRVFQAIPLATNTIIELGPEATHHLARVLRAPIGATLSIFNGEGGEYKGEILAINKKTIQVRLTEFNAREAEPELNLCLAQGISRGEKMDYTIQKAVELGVKKIVPLFTERCNVKLSQERSVKRFTHWQSIVRGACEQSGRNRIPDLLPPQTLIGWLPSVRADTCLVLAPHAHIKLSQCVVKKTADVILLIGPEGGLSEPEINAAEQQGFIPLNLGPRILRTETAAVAALTALQCLFGDLK